MLSDCMSIKTWMLKLLFLSCLSFAVFCLFSFKLHRHIVCGVATWGHHHVPLMWLTFDLHKLVLSLAKCSSRNRCTPSTTRPKLTPLPLSSTPLHSTLCTCTTVISGTALRGRSYCHSSLLLPDSRSLLVTQKHHKATYDPHVLMLYCSITHLS